MHIKTIKYLFLFNIFCLNVFFAKSSASLDSDLKFEKASIGDRQYLINFSVESNDIYKTRTSSRATAESVFDLTEDLFFKNGVCFLLKKNDDIVGFFALRFNKDGVELTHLFVKAGLQKKGYGSILFSKILDLARSRGYSRLSWVSDPDAAVFYIKQGARLVAYDQNLLNPAVPVPLFELNIQPI